RLSHGGAESRDDRERDDELLDDRVHFDLRVEPRLSRWLSPRRVTAAAPRSGGALDPDNPPGSSALPGIEEAWMEGSGHPRSERRPTTRPSGSHPPAEPPGGPRLRRRAAGNPAPGLSPRA